MTAADKQTAFDSDALKTLVAIIGSLLVNFAVLYAIGWFLLWQIQTRKSSEKAEPNEVVIKLEELIPDVIEVPSEEKGPAPYIDTYANQESSVAPLKPQFESDRNTLAATEMLPSEKSDQLTPTQDGKEAPIPVIDLQDHQFVDGPEGEIPDSAAAPAGMPAQPSDQLKIPQEESKNPKLMADLKPAKAAPEESEVMDPNQTDYQENSAESETKDAQVTDLQPGEAGGAATNMEMAKVDLEKTKSAFSDELQIVDENMPMTEDVEDAMPERNPEIVDPVNPMLQAPAPRPNAPIVPTPIAKPVIAAVPIQPGMQPTTQTNGDADSIAFSPERIKNKMSGSIDNLGRTAAVDAEKTPLGEYKKRVSMAIERRWHALRVQNATFVTFGSLKISFLVDRNGNVAPSQINLVHQDANSRLTDFTMQALIEADIPPMPEEIITLLGGQPLEVTYDIIIY
tara:strand:- start:2904 stop:4265 length:1362 start_codon:yes stop_codon:yes gene_type:complete